MFRFRECYFATDLRCTSTPREIVSRHFDRIKRRAFTAVSRIRDDTRTWSKNPMTSADRTIGLVERINLSSVVGCLSEKLSLIVAIEEMSLNIITRAFSWIASARYSLRSTYAWKKNCRNFYTIYMKYISFYSYLYDRNIFFSTRDILSMRLNESFFALTWFCTSSSQLLLHAETRIKFVGFFYFLLVMDRMNRGSSLCFSFFVADRKQLQIAGGIAAHGAQQTEVSENKMRAQQSRRNNKCNAERGYYGGKQALG